MPRPGSPALDGLRQQIAAIERRPMLARPAAESDALGYFGLPMGALHELFTPERRDAGAGLGFAFGLMRDFMSPARPALIFLQLVHDAQETGLPYGAGLVGFGIAPESLVMVRIAAMSELLWAVEEAVRCQAVAAVIADIAGWPAELDFTASRRLSLRTAASGTSVLLLRHGAGREASAARFRWQVMPLGSAPDPYDARAPGRPRWRVVLEKGRLKAGSEFILDWTDHGFAPITDERRHGAGAGAALPPAPPAALGHRLSEAG